MRSLAPAGRAATNCGSSTSAKWVNGLPSRKKKDSWVVITSITSVISEAVPGATLVANKQSLVRR